MIKPETKKQTNKFLENYGKFTSKLFNFEAIGDTKQEAEQNLLNLIEWNTGTFYKVFQHNNIVAMVRRSPYVIGNYQYFRIENDLEQGMYIFDAKSDREAIEKGQEWFNQYIS